MISIFVIGNSGLDNMDNYKDVLNLLFDPLDSKCDDFRDVCCRLPEWKDIPLDEKSKIKLPEEIPSACLEELKDDDYKK